jgi:hypothetical protein
MLTGYNVLKYRDQSEVFHRDFQFLGGWNNFTRMKKALLFAVLTTATLIAFSRTSSTRQIKIADMESNNDDSTLASPSIHDVLMEIMNVTGLHPNFELKRSKVMNIEASISHRKRLILYNPEYINWVAKSTKDRWGVIALFAHEIGHHLNGHTIRKHGSNHKVELEADEFAGFVMCRLGASLTQAQEVMNHIAQAQPSATHPSRLLRMRAIEKGWTQAKGVE